VILVRTHAEYCWYGVQRTFSSLTLRLSCTTLSEAVRCSNALSLDNQSRPSLGASTAGRSRQVTLLADSQFVVKKGRRTSTEDNELAATLRWFTAGGAIRIATTTFAKPEITSFMTS